MQSTIANIIEIRLWAVDHEWLYAVHKSPANTSPTFRFPDLLSACVSLALADAATIERLFRCLAIEIALREACSRYRHESMWALQYRELQQLQASPANRHPNPRFALDQLVAGCIVLARETEPTGANVLRQARVNMAQRAREALQACPQPGSLASAAAT